MSFNNRIKEARLNAGLTQEQLAERIGVAKSTVTGYEKGNSEPNMLTVQKIMETLEVDANFLWQDEMSNTVQFVITLDEKDHIKKYRQLDGYGKKVVDQVLSIEHERILEQSLTDQPQETEHASLIYENRLYMTEYDHAPSAGTGNYLDEWDIPKSTISVPDTPATRKADFVLRVSGDSMEPEYHDGDRVLVKSQDSVSFNDIAIYIIDGESYIKQYKGSYLHSLNPEYNDILLNDGQFIKCVGKVLDKI